MFGFVRSLLRLADIILGIRYLHLLRMGNLRE